MKTLKDIEKGTLEYWRNQDNVPDDMKRCYVDAYASQSKNLRQAAREWIEYIDDRDTLYSGHIVLINWIKEFFNLEEDE